MYAANTKSLQKSDHSNIVFFQDGVQDGRQKPCLLIIHVHMVNGQFRCTYTVYLAVILHVSRHNQICFIL